MAGSAGSGIGTGGMLTKVLAARRAANSGGHTVIASGREQNVLIRLANGERIGTELRAILPVRSARKRWLANHLRLRGRLTLDAGAVQALTHNHKSLLSLGVTGVEGAVERGDVTSCEDPPAAEHGRRLLNFSSGATRRSLPHPR